MTVFLEFADKASRARVLQSIEQFGYIESSCDGGLAVWFKSYSDENYDDLTDTLDDQSFEYELV